MLANSPTLRSGADQVVARVATNVKVTGTIYVIVVLPLIWRLGEMECWILARPWGLVFLPMAVVAFFCVRALLTQRETEPLVFDGQPDPVVRELGLSI